MPTSSADASDSAPSFLRRLLVWGGGLLGGLAVLVLVAALVLPRFFTSEQLKGYVVPPLEDATGRQVEIDAIGLRVLPAPAIRVSGFRLANAEGYGSAPAVKARALNVDVALWPLFVGTIRPTAVGLVDPVVRYEVAEDGATNFDDLGGESDTTEAEGPLLGGIPLSNVRVSGAQLHYTDRSTGQAARLNFDAQLGILPEGTALTSTGTVDLGTVRAVLPSVGPDTLAVQDARARYDVRVSPSAGQVDLRSVRLETAPLTLTAAGALSGLNDRPTIDLSFETEATDLAEIAAFVPAAAAEGLNPQGTIDLKGTVAGPLADTTAATEQLTVAAEGQLAGVGLDYEGTALLRELSASMSLSLDSVAVRAVQGRLLDASLAGAVTVQELGADPQIDLDLKTGAMDLAALAAFAPPEQVGTYNPQGTLRLDVTAAGPVPTDAASLEQLAVNGTGQLVGLGVDYGGQALLRSLKADLSFSGTEVSAREIDGRLLDKPLSGEVTVRDPMGAPQVDGRLAGAADLAQLAAVAGDDSGGETVRGTADYDVAFAGPLDAPDAIRPNGRVRLTDVQVPYESFRHPLEVPDATVQLTGTGLSMNRVPIRSGEQTVALQATMKNLFPISKGLADTDPALSASFTLTSDRLDLTALYPEADTGDVYYSQLFAAHLSGSEVEGQSPEALAEELYGGIELPSYAVDGRVEIKTLLNEPQRYDDLSVDVQMNDRRLELQNLSATTYGGTVTGTLTLDQSGSEASAGSSTNGSVLLASTGGGKAPSRTGPVETPSALTYDFELQEAEAGAVLEDWTSLGRLVTGTLTFNVDGNSRLTNGLLPETTALTAVGQSLVANGGLSLNVGPARALVNALNLPTASLKQFKRLGGPFAIEEGQLQMKSWTFGGSRFDGTVQGALGLGGSVDLEMTMKLPLSILQSSGLASRLGDGQLGPLLDKLVGGTSGDETVPVTVRFGGTMRDPTVQVLNREAIESKLRSIAKEKGLNRLRNLFGGDGG